MDAESAKRRLRSFLLGGVVGVSATLAAIGRRRQVEKRRRRPRGLAAFESAPCYLELVERERAAEREREQSSP